MVTQRRDLLAWETFECCVHDGEYWPCNVERSIRDAYLGEAGVII
jgi:hypothetical protein